MTVQATPRTMVMVLRLAKAIQKRSTEELLGMKLRQAMVLSHLRDVGGSTPQQTLCEWLWLDANNCVLMLNELEARGHVERRRDPSDRRRHVVDLTAAGREALRRAEQAREGLDDEVLAGLSREEREQLRELLARAVAALDA